MWRFSRISLVAVLGLLPMALAACQSSSDIGFRTGASQPRIATWRCQDAISSSRFTLTVRNQGSVLGVTDSRGVETDLPPDPPGQRERYGKTGFALVFAGRTASWFAPGQRPADCRR